MDVHHSHPLTRAAFAACVGLCLAACGGTRDDALPGSLTLGHTGDAVTLDPLAATDPSSRDVTALVYRTLVRREAGAATALPSEVQSWSAGRDGKTLRFLLRPGARFSDGTPLDAVAVAYNVERWQRARIAAGNDVAAVRTQQPATVVFVLRKRGAPLLRDLAEPRTGIVAPGSGAGSGPYAVVSWERGDAVTLHANLRYDGHAPRFTTVVVRNVPDRATAQLALEKRDIDALLDPTGDALGALATNAAVAVHRAPAGIAGNGGRSTIAVSATITGVTARDGTILTAENWSPKT